jgi:UDPglucose--hexose-1-phosphate uridylyltransferase
MATAMLKGKRLPAMAIEYEIRNGDLLWIRNPITGVISYVVDVRGKSFAFTLGGREEPDPGAPLLDHVAIAHETERCPFCPGNESTAPEELFRLDAAEVADQDRPAGDGAPWLIRVFNNLFPRIPDELTGNRNESYVVVEDPRHFVEHPRSLNDLLFTGALSEEHFLRILITDARVVRHSLSNPAVRSVVIRKNQGRESGASQPHVHQQIIGAPMPLPAIEAEIRATAENPGLWRELLKLIERLGLLIEARDGVVSFASPIGAFPRSYDVVMPEFCGLISELSADELRPLARALHRILRILGPLPLDYEIHQAQSLPLHVHVNARFYPYSNVAGTLNLPRTLLETATALRKALARG